MTSLPEVPTTDEAGLPGFYASIWFGMWAPKGTPQDVLDKLNAATVAALADDERERPAQQASASRSPHPISSRPRPSRAFQKSEADKWWPIMKEAGIKMQ